MCATSALSSEDPNAGFAEHLKRRTLAPDSADVVGLLLPARGQVGRPLLAGQR